MDKLNTIQLQLGAPDQQNQLREKIKAGGTAEFARQFESLFLRQLLQQMNKSMLSEGLFGESHQGKIFQGLFTDALAETITENGGIGLAEMLAKSLGDEPGGMKPDADTTELKAKMYKLSDRDYLSHTKVEQRKKEL